MVEASSEKEAALFAPIDSISMEERESSILHPFVSFTWKLQGPLGLKMMIRGRDADDEKGVQVSGFAESFPEDPSLSGIEVGMTVLAVNGQDVEHGSYNRVIRAIQAAVRPLQMEFGAPIPLVNGLKSKARLNVAPNRRHESGQEEASEEEANEFEEEEQEGLSRLRLELMTGNTTAAGGGDEAITSARSLPQSPALTSDPSQRSIDKIIFGASRLQERRSSLGALPRHGIVLGRTRYPQGRRPSLAKTENNVGGKALARKSKLKSERTSTPRSPRSRRGSGSSGGTATTFV